MNISEALHPPSGDDDADDGVAHRVRHLRLPAAAGRGAAARSTSRPSRSPRRCRARARRPWRPRSRRRSSGSCRPSPASSSMTSTSSLGRTTITIQFDLNRDIDGAALDVQTALSVAQRRLPVEMTTPPSFRKVNPGDFPVLFISLNSPTLPLSTVNEYAETVLAQQISQIAGRRAGAGLRRAEIRRARAGRSGRGRGAQHLARRHPHRRSPRPIPTRRSARSTGPSRTSRCSRPARCSKADGLPATSSSPGATARRSSSSEIADVIDSVENDKVASWFNDDRAIVLAIQRQPDANTVEVVDAVREQAAAVPRAGAAVDQDGGADRPLDLDPRVRRTTCRTRWRSRSRSSSW